MGGLVEEGKKANKHLNPLMYIEPTLKKAEEELMSHLPDMPEMPVPPPPTPFADTAGAQEQKELMKRETRMRASASGRSSTILTQGLGEPTQSGRKTLLGM